MENEKRQTPPRQTPLRRIATISLWAVLLVLLGNFMIDAFVRQMLYPIPRFIVPPAKPPLEEVRLKTSEGDKVIAWYDGTSDVDVTVDATADVRRKVQILFLHGNGENLVTLAAAGVFEEFRALGVDVLALDYPGYGRSSGRPSEAANVAAAVAGCEWLAERDPEARRIVMGWSLGAAVAAQAAKRCESNLHAVVLASPWHDLAGVAADHFPSFVVRMTVSDDYDSGAALRDVDLPLVLIHGDRDDLIPTRHGRSLRDALTTAGRDVQWVEVAGSGHNDLMGRREVWQAVAEMVTGFRAE